MIAGVDPDGLAGDVAQEVAAMAEAMGKAPPRARWIDAYRESEEADAVEGLASL